MSTHNSQMPEVRSCRGVDGRSAGQVFCRTKDPHCGVRQALALPAVRQSKCACDTPSKRSEGLLISISARVQHANPPIDSIGFPACGHARQRGRESVFCETDCDDLIGARCSAPGTDSHRQPTMNDLPPSLREEEKSGTEASPTQDPQAGCRRRAKRSAKRATTNAEGRARQWCSPNLRPLLTAPLTPLKPRSRSPSPASKRGRSDHERERKWRLFRPDVCDNSA